MKVKGSLAIAIVLAELGIGAAESQVAEWHGSGGGGGSQVQLFVDDWIVAERTGLTRELGQVKKANGGRPIFTEGWFYGTVLRDQGRFKMWYRKPGSSGYGYAESSDGLRFEKRADLTGINFAGDYTLAVEFDPHETDPQHRFKAAYDAPGMAAGIAHSTDGIKWNPYNSGRPVTGRAADSYNQILWDDVAKTYRLFTRTDFGPPGGRDELRGTRSMTNSDPKSQPTHWHIVRQWKFDQEGKSESNRRQIYAVTCWPHEGVYFALLSVYEYIADFSEGRTADFKKRHERDVMNYYLATSRDCDSWDLSWVYAGQPIVPRGPDGSFDKDLLLPASTIVTHDDKHWLYYAGGNERHGNEEVRFGRDHAIGLATLPLDRFVGLCAGDTPGHVVTKLLKLDGSKLFVNLDARGGEIQVELVDESGEPIANYSGPHSAIARDVDELRWPAHWQSTDDWSLLRGKNVRLRFKIRNAKLYAFAFVKA
jgi:hypothetical protein